MTATKGMVIVGAGEAGARAAVELRDQGWSGAIRL
jgi:3-phenylpropionate/trans-cinnamate dioxygenase ferredoxin reductase subunit